MLHQLYNISRDHHFTLCCSGGVDSMAIADFYHRGGKNFSVAYFHHNTPQADEMQACVEKWAKDNNHQFHMGRLGNKERPKDKSPEEFYRDERYAFLQSLKSTLVFAHHLDDAMETYLFRAINGASRLMASLYTSYPIVIVARPFLANRKSALVAWAKSHNVTWVEDKSNADVSIPRNRIRHKILPECLAINPGFDKVIKRMVIEAAHGPLHRLLLEPNKEI